MKADVEITITTDRSGQETITVKSPHAHSELEQEMRRIIAGSKSRLRLDLIRLSTERIGINVRVIHNLKFEE